MRHSPVLELRGNLCVSTVRSIGINKMINGDNGPAYKHFVSPRMMMDVWVVVVSNRKKMMGLDDPEVALVSRGIWAKRWSCRFVNQFQKPRAFGKGNSSLEQLSRLLCLGGQTFIK